MKLKDQIAIVTGAGQGMGRGIAEKLAQDGAVVVVAGRTEEKLLETVGIIESIGGSAFAVKADIRNIDDIKLIFDKCKEHFGVPDIFVANAGVASVNPLMQITEEEYYRVYDTNAKGTLFCLKEAGLNLNDGGRIVVVSSSSAKYPAENMSVYVSTKAAQNLMVQIAAQEFAPKKIRVNSVMPGVTETPEMKATLSTEFLQFIVDNTPLKRLGIPQDIAGVVAFLCSEYSGWITGQNIIVNGGCTV